MAGEGEGAQHGDSDPSLLIGWAGWDTPSLCLPWLKQWYNDIDSVYHQRLGDFHDTFLNSQLSTLGLAEDDLRAGESSNTGSARKRIRVAHV